MKNKSKEIIRLQNVIESDRLNVGKEFCELFIEDFNKLAKDYFDIDRAATLEIVKDKYGYKVEIIFYTTGTKPFSFIND